MEIIEEYKEKKDNLQQSNRVGIGFYNANQPFIIGKDVSFFFYEQENDHRQLFLSLKEVVYTYTNKDFDLYIYRDGLFLISFNDFNYDPSNPANCHKFIQYANIVQAIAHIASNQNIDYIEDNDQLNNSPKTYALIDIQEISTFDIIIISSQEQFSNYKLERCSLQNYKFSKMQNDYSFFINECSQYHCWEDDDFKIFTKFLEDNLKIIFSSYELMQIVLIMKGSAIAVKNMHYDRSMVLSFFAIERIINIFWDEFIREKNMKKKLEDDKNYTIAIRSTILYFNNKLSKEMLDNIDSARKIRNNIVHGKYNVFYNSPKASKSNSKDLFEESGKIHLIACKLISEYFKISFNIHYGTQF